MSTTPETTPFQPETLSFQAETKALLRMMIHALYTDKDIFLRELISNASDALDRLRFESLTNDAILEGNEKFEIRLDVDKSLRTLTISDSGIGMTRDEVVANIGTIAKSGTRELRAKLAEAGNSPDSMKDLIGQFGVGFYSAFMVADKVRLVTRKAGQSTAVQWESEGLGEYSISPAHKDERGTSITLFLKLADHENGMDDYTDDWKISSIVRKHSDFINYPVIAKREKPAAEKDAPPVVEDVTLNSMRPIWKRSPSEIKPEEYNEFYKHVTHDWTDPLRTIHFRAEGTFEYEALVYIPGTAPHDLYYAGAETGLRLFASRVMIMERCEDLIPSYLRFLRGVVDASDLPLNISRQRLQQDRHIAQIRKRLTTKALDTLAELQEKDLDLYLKIWKEFGRAIKEGLGADYDNRERITSLLLFQSSADPEKLVSLKDYVARMKPDQEQIFYLTGETRAAVEYSPHLEAVKAKDYEVLFMVDPVDEFMLQYLTEFEGKKLKSVGKGDIEVGSGEEKEEARKEIESKQEEFKPLLDFLQKELDAHVKQVRLSSRLTTSPVCLVVEENELSPVIERALRKMQESAPERKRIMELNPKHPLIQRMQQRLAGSPTDAILLNAADLLWGLALLAEGSELPEPAKFSKAATEVLGQVV